MKTKELKLTNIHLELLQEISGSRGPFNLYKSNFTKEELKCIKELIDAGEVLKVVERINYNGRFSTRVTLSIKR